MRTEPTADFAAWLSRAVAGSSDGIAGYCFNLYEGEDGYDVELVGASRFDPEDDSWPCEEVAAYRDELFHLAANPSGSWEVALAQAVHLVRTALSTAPATHPLKRAEGVAVGFVDGDLTIVWPPTVTE